MPFFGQLDFSAPTWDVFLLLFFMIGALLYGLTLGRDRIVVIMVSIYMGLAVVTNAPYIRDISAAVSVNDFAFKIGTFLGVFVLLFFFLSKNALIRSLDTGGGGRLLQTVMFSVLHVGLLISVGLTFLPESAMTVFSDQTRMVFVSDPAKFVWLVAPIAAMMIFSGRKE
ncbi:MAG: hypothetical protein AAB554_02240 [Patescibacteria group bacterium]